MPWLVGKSAHVCEVIRLTWGAALEEWMLHYCLGQEQFGKRRSQENWRVIIVLDVYLHASEHVYTVRKEWTSPLPSNLPLCTPRPRLCLFPIPHLHVSSYIIDIGLSSHLGTNYKSNTPPPAYTPWKQKPAKEYERRLRKCRIPKMITKKMPAWQNWSRCWSIMV